MATFRNLALLTQKAQGLHNTRPSLPLLLTAWGIFLLLSIPTTASVGFLRGTSTQWKSFKAGRKKAGTEKHGSATARLRSYEISVMSEWEVMASRPEPSSMLSAADEREIDPNSPLDLASSSEKKVTEKESDKKPGTGIKQEASPLTFDMIEAGKLWDKKVGCANFRKKHKDLIHKYASSRWQQSDSFQNPNRLNCSSMNLRHVNVHIAHTSWFIDWIDSTSFCPRCSLSCTFSRSRVSSLPAHALFYEGKKPPLNESGPVRVYLNLEALPGKSFSQKDGVDVWVGYGNRSGLQATYAAEMFHMSRNRHVAEKKREDIIAFHAASNVSPWRDSIVKRLLPLIPTHSFGQARNNAGRNTELTMYPQCSMAHVPEKGGEQQQQEQKREESQGKETWAEFNHCVQSHYKFSLAVENTREAGYATEKLFYPLEVGTVPIYFGAPDVAEFVPPDSFIDGSKITDTELKKLVGRLNTNPVAYMGFHAWRRCGVLGNYVRSRAMSLDTMPCRLCELVSSMRGGDGGAATT